MKNIMKTATTILLILALTSTLGVFATESYVHESNQFEVIFDEDTVFTEMQKQNIISHLTDQSDPTITTMANLICTVLGHDLTVGRTTATQHLYYSTAPKCLKETYDISACSRCDYVSSTLVLSVRTTCCS